MNAITAENYVEISPVGEVDGREKMLAFYAPEQKRPSPQLQVDEPVVRLFGDTALISARLSYRLNQDGTARSFALRAGYVARLVDKQWLLVSAQYTGIRPPKP
ncbi:nuclear transport factor 2 family protein [Janthinobacterium sp. SUN128]|uniref:nuclear transport factor 2 family protein n=1 Tax=Janthinobacterium sp. SUN128 TaxID=3014790 RepID=UPI002712E64A|nr:nuclear transport factor 2 family protein [Janthinobacterium sp. SUN128]MDO8033790.1 nuclear transport factor 2 family protein [Janthinobacterium sp. SUN128]